MINTKDQEELFKLIADYLEENINCIAIGGTAMMFSNYKTTTKDIDLVFQTEEKRNIFIKAIEKLGYKEKAIGNVYDKKRKEHKGKPVMYTRGDERFDLFVKNVFGYKIEFEQETHNNKTIGAPKDKFLNKIIQRNDFLGKKELTIYILPKEELILLKAITGREKDYEDIETILEIEKVVDWKTIVENAIKQKKKNSWILIDLEETLQKLKKKFFIKQEIFEAIYKEQN
jgi:hypothetical protein